MTEKAKPIMFSAPMVRAILDGRKTQTRRVLKTDGSLVQIPPIKLGNCLWVREPWRTESNDCDIWAPSKLGGGETILFEADANWKDNKSVGRLRASMHMPRWASRITLEVTAVKVERLQDINRGDAMEEGCPFPNMANGDDPRQWFSKLWETINGPHSWEANPWVSAYSFKVLE
jgi:hypothetical protein